MTPRKWPPVRQAWAGFWILLVLFMLFALGLHFSARVWGPGIVP